MHVMSPSTTTEYSTPLGKVVYFSRLMLPPPGQRDEIVVLVAGSNGVLHSQVVECGWVVPLNDSASLPAKS